MKLRYRTRIRLTLAIVRRYVVILLTAPPPVVAEATGILLRHVRMFYGWRARNTE